MPAPHRFSRTAPVRAVLRAVLRALTRTVIPRGPTAVLAVVLAAASSAPGWAQGEPAAAESRAGAGGKRDQETFTLSIKVSDLRNDKGQLAVALFNSEEGFPKQEHAFAGKLARIENGRAVVRFDGLEPGIYAAAVLHDENSNSKMDFNFVGIPLEGYGFSNDASAAFGPPSFEAAAFRLKARRSALPIRARYFWR